MAIQAGVCNTAKLDWINGVNQPTDVYKIALYALSATLSPSATTAYSTTGEITASGYTAGGLVLSGFNTAIDTNVAIMTFSNPFWVGATIVAAGALIYNSSNSDSAILVIDFQGNAYSTNGSFTLQFPAFDATNALIKLA